MSRFPSAAVVRQTVVVRAGSAALFAAAGIAVTRPLGMTVVLGLAALVVAVAVLLRPLDAMILWFALVLADPYVVTRIHIPAGSLPIYPTEIVLMLVVAGLAIAWMTGRRYPPLPRDVRLFLFILGPPAVLSALIETNIAGGAWLRNFALVYYAVIAAIASLYEPSVKLYRRLVVLGGIGCAFATFEILSNYGATSDTTNTGAQRLGGVWFSIPVGIAALVIVALVRERVVRARWLWAAVPPLAALVGVNHRSAWLAFVFALFVVLHRAPGWKLVVSGALICLVLVSVTFMSTGSTISSEVKRVQSIGNLNDPNGQYRISFSRTLVVASLKSPLWGKGFDDYPASLTPYRHDFEGRQDPHDSYAALAYRIGLLPTLLFIAALVAFVMRAVRTGARCTEPVYRAALFGLAGAIVFQAVTTAMNVLLEAPYGAVPFWMCIGLLATLEHRVRTGTLAEASA